MPIEDGQMKGQRKIMHVVDIVCYSGWNACKNSKSISFMLLYVLLLQLHFMS